MMHVIKLTKDKDIFYNGIICIYEYALLLRACLVKFTTLLHSVILYCNNQKFNPAIIICYRTIIKYNN